MCHIQVRPVLPSLAKFKEICIVAAVGLPGQEEAVAADSATAISAPEVERLPAMLLALGHQFSMSISGRIRLNIKKVGKKKYQ